MSASELSDELLGVKDNSLVIANRVISGPLTIDAEQKPVVPITFKVEFRNCEFTDNVVVRRVDFGQSLKLLHVKFDGKLLLDHVNVKGDLHLENLQAGKPIQIFQSQVDGDVHIRNPEATALQIENLTASNVFVGLGKSRIAHLDFRRLVSGRLSISAAAGATSEVDQLDLDSVNLRETLTLQNVELQEVTADTLTVAKRVLFLPVTTIKKRLDLTSASLGGFEWRFAGPVEFPQHLEINGTTFGSLGIARVAPAGAARSGDGSSHLRADRIDYGLRFLQRAEYYEPAYSSYESALKIRGQSDKADDVYFAMRDRRRYAEFRDAESAWDKTVAAFNYVIGFGHKWLFGYGRAWVYPLVWCIVLVLLGAVIFRDGSRMERVDAQSSQAFSPIWYSVDLFVPILSLGVAKHWNPKQEFRLLHFYSKFLSLVGLIFISAMAGALTGTLK